MGHMVGPHPVRPVPHPYVDLKARYPVYDA